MLSEPVSAQEVGGAILILMFGAGGIGAESEERLLCELLFWLTLIKVTSNVLAFSRRRCASMRGPNRQPLMVMHPPGGVLGSVAARCWAVYFRLRRIWLQAVPAWVF